MWAAITASLVVCVRAAASRPERVVWSLPTSKGAGFLGRLQQPRLAVYCPPFAAGINPAAQLCDAPPHATPEPKRLRCLALSNEPPPTASRHANDGCRGSRIDHLDNAIGLYGWRARRFPVY